MGIGPEGVVKMFSNAMDAQEEMKDIRLQSAFVAIEWGYLSAKAGKTREQALSEYKDLVERNRP